MGHPVALARRGPRAGMTRNGSTFPWSARIGTARGGWGSTAAAASLGGSEHAVRTSPRSGERSAAWSRGPERLGRYQLLIRLRQQAREQRTPYSLPLRIGDQVLADFDRNVMQAASLSVHRDRVIRRIGHAVGLVVANGKPSFASQQRHEEAGETRIAIV